MLGFEMEPEPVCEGPCFPLCSRLLDMNVEISHIQFEIVENYMHLVYLQLYIIYLLFTSGFK